MKSKIRIRKSEDDRLYVVKTEKFVGEEEIENIRAKQERARIQRKERRLAKNRNHRN